MTDQSTTEEQASPKTTETATAPNADGGNPAAPKPDAGKAPDPGTLEGAGQGQKATEKSADADTGAGEGDAKGDLQRLRETLAGGDEGLLKALERYRSTEAISKAFKEARAAAKNSGAPLRLGEKPTPEEVKAFREAYGIPDEADAYPAAFREDYQASDADKAILGEFKAAMHGRNVDPSAAQAALEWYQDFALQQQQDLDGNLAKVAKETQAALRSEWGGEYDGNIGAVQEFMTAQLGKDGFEGMMGLRLMDGSRLQDHAAFVKMMAQVSTDYYGSNAIYQGDIETTSKTVQERIDGLLKLRGGSKEEQQEYFSDKVQGELTKLYSQREKINARKG